MNNIQLIKISAIHPHPDNPRKDLGDLTELADSIRTAGVMQNLTVVPHKSIEGEYTVIIGHRRLGASKLAGLDTVPCVVTEMTDKDQLATMMLENMQRSDLTVYEQAKGFQLMMDFGETVDSIADKTGLSKTTIRNRVKIAKYDQDVMREAATRQPTMEQYMRLSEIEDIEKANYVARFLGTKNFDREVNIAIDSQKRKRDGEILRAKLLSFAKELEDASYDNIQALNLVSVESFYLPLSTDAEKKIEERSKDGTDYFFAIGYGYTLYRKRSAEDHEMIARQKEYSRIREDLAQRAEDLYLAMQKRAEEFVQNYRRGDQAPIITAALIENAALGDLSQGKTYYGVARSLGWEYPEDLRTWEDTYRVEAMTYIIEEMDKNASRVALHTLWTCLPHRDVCHIPYNGTKLEMYKNHEWRVLLGLLEKLGYNVAQDEWDFITGHHPIYSEEIERY